MPTHNVCRCFLCRKLATARSVLTDFTINAVALDLLLARFGKSGLPQLCFTCSNIFRAALSKLDSVMESPLAQHMVLTAQAFANRDLWRGIPDVGGRQHTGLLFSSTCKWEPVLGRTARTARRAVHKVVPNQKFQALSDNYKVATKANKRKGKKTSTTTTPVCSLEALISTTTAFAAPFFELMVQALEFDSATKSNAVGLLSANWATAHGGGRVINGVLFGGAHIVAEDISDLRRSNDKILGSHYASARANEVFGCLLCFSCFGDAILQTSCQPPQSSDKDFILVDPDASFWRSMRHNFQSDPARLQRFLFKLCELRKASMGTRKNFRADWQCPQKRARWLAQNTEHICPCWKRSSDEHLPPFATVDWKTGGVETAMQIREEALAHANNTRKSGYVLSSEEFGEAMARWRQRWEADQGEGKRSRDAFHSFVHTCLGHRTLARAIVQFGFSSRQQLITALRRAEDWCVAQRTAQTGNPMSLLETYFRYRWYG
ncbi:unnamed protein product [Symbiodinium sp. CCMP2456]|nr:unnamed protein product [Symbiodinium sp. CCMP2456]